MTALNPGGQSEPATGANSTPAGPAAEPSREDGSIPGRAPGGDLDRTIARLLTRGTYLSIGLLAIGFALLVRAGIGPLDGGPPFDLARLGGDLVALRPDGFLWLGLVAVVATPTARVVASLVGYIRRGEPRMALISTMILGIITLSVVLAKGLEG